MLIECGSIGYNNTEAYVYRQRSESITHTISYKNIYDLSNNVKKCVRFGQEIPKGTKSMNYIMILRHISMEHYY